MLPILFSLLESLAIVQNSNTAIYIYFFLMLNPQTARLFPHHVTSLGEDCGKLRETLGLYRHPEPTEEERGFPIAYTIVFHKGYFGGFFCFLF